MRQDEIIRLQELRREYSHRRGDSPSSCTACFLLGVIEGLERDADRMQRGLERVVEIANECESTFHYCVGCSTFREAAQTGLTPTNADEEKK